MLFFAIRGPDFWGDYGRILTGGIVRRSQSESQPNQLLRTGPFIPPISFPFRHVVVTNDFRDSLTNANLGNFKFRTIEKQRIRKLPWERWDRDADLPARYPRGGEPEDYLFQGWHSRSAAKAMGQIWELVLPASARTGGIRVKRERPRKPGQRLWDVMVDGDSWLGDHFFQSINQGYLVATETGANWLSAQFGDWLTLRQCLPWDPGKLNAEP
ncbi:MAG: hypothetical protein WBD20_19050 [Pirellulaceae bacterium]